MRSVNRIRTRLENLEWVLIRLEGTNGLFGMNNNLIKTTKASIDELNWVLGKPKVKE